MTSVDVGSVLQAQLTRLNLITGHETDASLRHAQSSDASFRKRKSPFDEASKSNGSTDAEVTEKISSEILSSDEEISPHLERDIRSIRAHYRQLDAHAIAGALPLQDGRKVPWTHVQSYLTSHGLDNAAARAAGGVEVLPSKSSLSADIKRRIRKGVLQGQGSRAIANALPLQDGRKVPWTRVQSYLMSRGLNNAAARAAGGVEVLPSDSPLSEYIERRIREGAAQNQGSRAIAHALPLQEGRVVGPSRVQSYLTSQGLDNAAARAAGGLQVLPKDSPLSADTEQRIREGAAQNQGSRAIAHALPLQNGRAVGPSRVQSYLKRHGLQRGGAGGGRG